MRRLAAPLAALAVTLALAAPTLACGGLIGPNGAVNLLRTTTLAGYHDGVEHYVTAFEFAGGGGSFGSLIPLPGIPTSVVRGGDWTLQRLVRETDPPPAFAFEAVGARGPAPSSSSRSASTRSTSPSSRAAAPRSGSGPRSTASRSRPMRPRCSTSTPAAHRSSWPPPSTPMRPPRAARRSAMGRRSTSPSRPTTPGSRSASWASARPPARSVQADVYLLTDDRPALLPDPGSKLAAGGMRLAHSEAASEGSWPICAPTRGWSGSRSPPG